jgi:hypothetical protein
MGPITTASYFFFVVLVFFAGDFFLHAPQLTRPTSLLEEIGLAQPDCICAVAVGGYHVCCKDSCIFGPTLRKSFRW